MPVSTTKAQKHNSSARLETASSLARRIRRAADFNHGSIWPDRNGARQRRRMMLTYPAFKALVLRSIGKKKEVAQVRKRRVLVADGPQRTSLLDRIRGLAHKGA